MNLNYYAVIMAGGIGSRFWPLSRTEKPKQFLDILGVGETLIQMTYKRFAEIIPAENIYVVTNQQYTNLVLEQLPELNETQILAEPILRNTAPCIAYSYSKILKMNPKALIAVSPSDHFIRQEDAFLKNITHCLSVVEQNNILLTMGIQPTRPDTGYGYIQLNEDEELMNTFKVKTFTEKPNREIAQSFINSGDFVWNSGIFFFSANAINEAYQLYLPDIHDLFHKTSRFYSTKNEAQKIKEVYEKCKNISIDYGIMENAQNVYVMRTDVGWSDLGTWNSLYEQSQKDFLQNALNGNVIIYDSTHNIVHTTEGKLTILKGVDDLIIVETADTLLVCHKDQEQFIKEIVGDLKKNYSDLYS